MDPKSHKLSIVVPAYRQAKTIVRDISRIGKVLSQLRYQYEIIVVIDGYGDGTYRVLKKAAISNVKPVTYMKNQGKGHAVRLGMTYGTGDYVAFIDSGMEIDPNGIAMLLEHMEWYNADIIVGSKRHPASMVEYPLERKVLSSIYQIIVWLLFRLKVRDTQSGIKIFKRKVLEKILPRLLVKRYAFDLEMLTVANTLGFSRIFEAPIKLNYNFSDVTHAANIEAIMKIMIDTAAIFYRIHILRYYDDKNWDGKKTQREKSSLISNLPKLIFRK